MAQVLRLLGYWPPLFYAVATFTLFWLLDRKAAPRARKAITAWFSGPKYDKKQVAEAVLYVFDRFYTTPLWGWRAILRSALVSIAVTAVLSYQIYWVVYVSVVHVPEMRWSIYTQVAANVVADYLSLFFIRRWLCVAGGYPLLALTTAPLIGAIIVTVVYLFRDVGGFSFKVGEFHWRYIGEDFYEWYALIRNRGVRMALLVPAVVVHLWLPLFALGVVIAQLMNSFRAAGRFAQWFFAQGEAHPIRSIGYIAAAAVLLGTMIISILGHPLS